MEWQLRIILGIIGVVIIGIVAYDGWRRNRKKKAARMELSGLKVDPESRDSAGFDMDGIGEVRVKSLDETEMPIDQDNQLDDNEHIIATRDDKIVIDKSNAISSDEEDVVDPDVEPELIFSVTLLAPDEAYSGEALLQALVERGCRHGDMDIFHRYKSPQETRLKYFSVANAFQPGTFDLNNMPSEMFKGISFFMGVPGSAEPEIAYQTMVETARAIKGSLGGKLMDSSRSVFTEQTRQHEIEQIKEYKRRNLTKV